MNAQSWIEQQFWVRLYLIDRKAPMPIGSGGFPPLQEPPLVAAYTSGFHNTKMVMSGLERLVPEAICVFTPLKRAISV